MDTVTRSMQMMTPLVPARSAKRSGRAPVKKIAQAVSTYSSRGANSTSPPSQTGNTFYNLSEAGNPFDGSQDGAYAHFVVALDMKNFFSGDIFLAYDNYRVKEIETTFTMKDMPENRGLSGEILFCIDKDSRTVDSLKDTCNRNTLQTRIFTNNTVRHIVSWSPYLVEDSETFDVSGKQVDFVMPQNRWLNTNNVSNHRFGSLKCVVSVPNGSHYGQNFQAVSVRHRVTVEFKGLKTVQ